MLAISAVASLLILAGVWGTFKRRDYPGRVRVSPPPDPVLYIVFDPPVEPLQVPLSHNRGYWFDPKPPAGLCDALVQSNRLVFRWDRIEVPGVGWRLDRLEYRVTRGEETLRFYDDSPLSFWGIIVTMVCAPVVVGAVIAATLGLTSGRREAEGT